MEGKLKNSQKFPQEWEAFQRCGSSRFLSVEEQFDAHLAVIGRYSQLLKNKHKEIVLNPESIGFTSNQRTSNISYNSQKTNIQKSNDIVFLESLANIRGGKVTKGYKPSTSKKKKKRIRREFCD